MVRLVDCHQRCRGLVVSTAAVVNNACLMSNSMRGGFFASPSKITRAGDDLFLIAAGVQIYLTSAANRHVPGEECIAIDENLGDLLPSGGRKNLIDFGHS